jgi:hypothetical protein
MKRHSKFAPMWLLLVFAVLLALPRPASADDVNITVVGPSPFIYGGCAYVPLKSVTDFIGAALLWDSLKGRAVITYGGKELGLVIGSPTAYYLARPVVLPAPPVIVGGRVFVPMVALKKYLAAPVVWDADEFSVRIKGQKGWGVLGVEKRPPWHGSPPPWAPAWGVRGVPPGHAKKGGAGFFGFREQGRPRMRVQRPEGKGRAKGRHERGPRGRKG